MFFATFLDPGDLSSNPFYELLFLCAFIIKAPACKRHRNCKKLLVNGPPILLSKKGMSKFFSSIIRAFDSTKESKACNAKKKIRS